MAAITGDRKSLHARKARKICCHRACVRCSHLAQRHALTCRPTGEQRRNPPGGVDHAVVPVRPSLALASARILHRL